MKVEVTIPRNQLSIADNKFWLLNFRNEGRVSRIDTYFKLIGKDYCLSRSNVIIQHYEHQDFEFTREHEELQLRGD